MKRQPARVFEGKLVLCQGQGEASQPAADRVLTGLSWTLFSISLGFPRY